MASTSMGMVWPVELGQEHAQQRTLRKQRAPHDTLSPLEAERFRSPDSEAGHSLECHEDRVLVWSTTMPWWSSWSSTRGATRPMPGPAARRGRVYAKAGSNFPRAIESVLEEWRSSHGEKSADEATLNLRLVEVSRDCIVATLSVMGEHCRANSWLVCRR